MHTARHNPPKVVIVVLNRNGLTDTRECLHSLGRLEYPAFEVILVDNSSTDESVANLRDEFPSTRVIESGQNLGFAGGNNLGIEMALSEGAEYVLLLNNDTIVDPKLLLQLVNIGDMETDIGILGPKIFYASDPRRIWYAGGEVIRVLGICRHIGLKQEDAGQKYSRIIDTGFVTGCAMMVKATVFRQIGLLDSQFFMYWEDADFCMKAREACFRCVFVPSAHVWHKVSRSAGVNSPFTTFLSTRNQLTWITRHVPSRFRWIAVALAIVRRLIPLPFTAIRDRGSAAAVYEGIRSFVTKRGGPPPIKKFAPPSRLDSETARFRQDNRRDAGTPVPPVLGQQ